MIPPSGKRPKRAVYIFCVYTADGLFTAADKADREASSTRDSHYKTMLVTMGDLHLMRVRTRSGGSAVKHRSRALLSLFRCLVLQSAERTIVDAELNGNKQF